MIKWQDALIWLQENEWDELCERILIPHAAQGDYGMMISNVISSLDNNETRQEEIVELYYELKRND